MFIADWLLRHNHIEGKDKPIKGMEVQVDVIQTTMDIPECVSIAEIQQASFTPQSFATTKRYYNFRLATYQR